ncbi:Craniofacial development protein 1 [Eumeta japonica]|uniref:Craniofacial development protein 1 n=1 Tax=Eumeta variegata TaxID=151549 RepID=A0A4C1TYJ9_EUMVA|nr:Craniofacial development protein 1 [Eumeta japonica]
MSSGSESDEDYTPGEPEKLSEEESADEETDIQYEKELEQKMTKRKARNTSKTKKKRRADDVVVEVNKKKLHVEESEKCLGPEDEKKREDDLWAKFLEGTDTIPKTISKQNNTDNFDAELNTKIKETNTPMTTQNKVDKESREQRIFEFAGETIVVENNVIKEKIKTDPAQVKPGVSTAKGHSSGGLSNLLSQINKKNKLSTLEKSKLDWDTYKKEEGIEEEIQSHNKGKHGYLDRRDFLERADLRQYEIERDLRMSRRSHRH